MRTKPIGSNFERQLISCTTFAYPLYMLQLAVGTEKKKMSREQLETFLAVKCGFQPLGIARIIQAVHAKPAKSCTAGNTARNCDSKVI